MLFHPRTYFSVNRPCARGTNRSAVRAKDDDAPLFCTAAFPLVRQRWTTTKNLQSDAEDAKQLPLSTGERNCLSISIARLGVGAHFLPKAAVPLLPT